ncbi:MAG: glycosyltransferase family 8 protein [Firmicutes bacterium]|nr:glycosyltransferase family 8 protein [Bacillota bacterium]
MMEHDKQSENGVNILYCGDRNIEDGLLLSTLSLLRHTAQPLHIFVMTMDLTLGERKILPVSQETVRYLNDYVRRENRENSVTRIDASALFLAELPAANLRTRFTPCCMLRLFADRVPELPERILYLDNDVLCRGDYSAFYRQDMAQRELAGVLDYYGKWFFRNRLCHMDYVNSGVLLLNLARIRETGLFARCRVMCHDKRMFMPDQSAINKLAQSKTLWSRAYNEQRRLHQDTVFQHFTTSFRFFPWIHTLTVKPWQIEQVHQKLKLHEYDDIFREYTELTAAMKGYLL